MDRLSRHVVGSGWWLRTTQHGEKLSKSFVMDRKNSLGFFFLWHVVACFSWLATLRLGLRLRLVECPFRIGPEKVGRWVLKIGTGRFVFV